MFKGNASTRASDKAPRKPLQKMTRRQVGDTKLHTVCGIRGCVNEGSINTTIKRDSNTAATARPAVINNGSDEALKRNLVGFSSAPTSRKSSALAIKATTLQKLSTSSRTCSDI